MLRYLERRMFVCPSEERGSSDERGSKSLSKAYLAQTPTVLPYTHTLAKPMGELRTLLASLFGPYENVGTCYSLALACCTPPRATGKSSKAVPLSHHSLRGPCTFVAATSAQNGTDIS